MLIRRTLSFRAKLSSGTHASLDAFLNEMRHLWNAALEERIDFYRKTGDSITWVAQFKSLTEVRRDDPAYARCSLEAQRSVLKRLDLAFAGFFRRLKAGEKPGFPRFRGASRRVRSFELPAPKIYSKGRWKTVSVKGIGRFRFSGEVDGEPKILRIVKTPRRVKVQVIVEREVADVTDLREPLGIDVGIKSRIAVSSGETVPGRKLDRTALKRKQRILSRAQKGSRSRCRKRQSLAREWQRVTERERGTLHELSAKLVKDHGAKFYVEGLKINNMVRGGKNLSRGISEQNWGAFVSMLAYKAEEAGGWVRKVPARNTSQRCSSCGAMPAEKVTLDVRTYECASCGHTADRDVNAAMNILAVGLALDQPGGAPPARRKEEEQRGAGRKAGQRVTAQNGIRRRAA